MSKVEFIEDIMIVDDLLDSVTCQNLIDYTNGAIEIECAGTMQHESTPGRLDTQVFATTENMLVGEQFSFFRHGMSGDALHTALFDKAINPYLDKYSILKQVPLCSLDIKLQRTPPGGGFHTWHYETSSMASCRVLTWSVFLNDDYEAGETEFLYKQLRVTPKTGRAAVFPCDFLSTHRGNPPMGGVKYLATGWLTNANPFGWDQNAGQTKIATFI